MYPTRSLPTDYRHSFWLGLLRIVLVLLATHGDAEQPRYRDRQIVVPRVNQQAEAAPLPAAQRRSLVRQAAYAEMAEEPAPRLVKRSPVMQSSMAGRPNHHVQTLQPVRQASFGCECGSCSGEPTCGYEVAHVEEAGCGAEGCMVGGCDGGCDPGCGSEWMNMEASCGTEAIGAGGCNACGEPSCGGRCLDSYNFCLPIFRLEWNRFEFFAGANSFTGPANYANTAATPSEFRNGSSSFGFYEGVNKGRSLRPLFGFDLAMQLGVRGTQTSLSGAEFTDETRNQIFVTGGLFRRVDFGLQYGLVVDYLNDDWWFQNDLVQLRGELSWNDGCTHEFGYQFMAGVEDSTSATTVFNAAGTRINGTVSFEPTDQHRFFFRANTGGGGHYYAFVGGTDSSDGLLGGGLVTAPRRGFAFQAGTTYLIPNQGRRNGGNENESWNMSMGLVYRPGKRQASARYSRPLFEVADNGTFMVDRL